MPRILTNDQLRMYISRQTYFFQLQLSFFNSILKFTFLEIPNINIITDA